jgi:anti-sigma regulatory factor (Ser/Thr protein kinase)
VDIKPPAADIPGPAAVYSRTFPARPENVAAVRAFTRQVLGGNPCCDDAVLVASELAGNSVRHSRSGRGGHIAVDIAVFAGPVVQMYVADAGGDTTPHVVPEACRDQGGRGLALVESLTAMWGYLQSGGGGTTWCELT